MSVIIEPSEQLEFHRPFTRISKESLHVKNPGTEPIIFKVKTTAPKQYCVRPNAGRIEPNAEIEVQIILQPFKEELPEDYKCKDKFLVQTAPIHESFEQQDITSMWTHVETTERASMHQHKIKCVFVGPREGDSEVIEQNVPIVEEEKKVDAPIPEQVNPIASSSTTSNTNTTTTTNPAQTTSSSNTTLSSSRDIPPVPAHREDPSFSIASTHAPAATESVAADAATEPVKEPSTVAAHVLPTVAPAESIKPIARDIPSSTTTTAQVDNNNNKDKELNEALEKIKRLEQQLAELQKEEGLRSRNNNSNNGGGRKLAPTVQPLDAVHQHLAALEKPRADEGYPPQVVLIVAALVFIFTYLFF